MDIEEVASKIGKLIEDDTIFDSDCIEKILKMMKKHKPQYNSYEFLGLGGQGLVLQVNNEKALKIVKLTKGNLDESERIQEKINILQKFQQSDYIIKVYENYFLTEEKSNEDKKLFYVIEMELCNYSLMTYLNDLRKNKKAISEQEKHRLCIQALDAVHFLHQKGICHRDIKPQNFLIKKMENGNVTLKLSDFGCSKTGKYTQCGNSTLVKKQIL